MCKIRDDGSKMAEVFLENQPILTKLVGAIIGAFRTEKRVRQGFLLCPTLFNIVFSVVEKEMRKAQESEDR